MHRSHLEIRLEEDDQASSLQRCLVPEFAGVGEFLGRGVGGKGSIVRVGDLHQERAWQINQRFEEEV